MRKFIEFFKTPGGRLVLFLLILAVALGFILGGRSSRKVVVAEPQTTAPQTKLTKVGENVSKLKVNQPKTATDELIIRPKPKHKEPPPPIDLYTAEIPPVGSVYAPFGRLIPCELVITVDSSRSQTPIVGLTLQDVWHGGELVIPVGTEVHGTAQVDRSRERIASQKEWTLVWQDGRELPVTGIALDHATGPDGTGWDITDGSAGLKGELIKTDNLAEIKLFASTFIAAAAAGLTDQETFTSPLGTTTRVEGSLRNALASGVSQTLNQYARQILQRVQQDGFYVRVPSGKTFYLYVTETLDISQAQIAGTTINPAEGGRKP